MRGLLSIPQMFSYADKKMVLCARANSGPLKLAIEVEVRARRRSRFGSDDLARHPMRRRCRCHFISRAAHWTVRPPRPAATMTDIISDANWPSTGSPDPTAGGGRRWRCWRALFYHFVASRRGASASRSPRRAAVCGTRARDSRARLARTQLFPTDSILMTPHDSSWLLMTPHDLDGGRQHGGLPMGVCEVPCAWGALRGRARLAAR